MESIDARGNGQLTGGLDGSGRYPGVMWQVGVSRVILGDIAERAREGDVGTVKRKESVSMISLRQTIDDRQKMQVGGGDTYIERS
jgi:hypothetical protein